MPFYSILTELTEKEIKSIYNKENYWTLLNRNEKKNPYT